ncbi:MAG TPA: Gfo/Idh/MocA family oxidoreductase [Candidatus Binataceae bacterium]|nr:Gfo/Idh/MocA family oxidoreductase [Candidatus Binataceae bacterium]
MAMPGALDSDKLRVGVVGCGLIGGRRAAEASRHSGTVLRKVADANTARARELAAGLHAEAVSDWHQLVDDRSLDIVVVSTPNAYLAPIAIAALESGKHVLVEKPPGRNLEEAKLIAAAQRVSGKVLKVGFNHRYHPALARAYQLLESGTIGDIFNVRARYGHGGRPGYEKEWRGNAELAGGGELTDQGVHLADLVNWMLGMPQRVFCLLQTAAWPIAPLEDNAFALLDFANGCVASFHTSWTQWKNLFSFEIFGTRGALCVEGLGGSYGTERLLHYRRKPDGGAPDLAQETFDSPDCSWKLEWQDFIQAIRGESACLGTAEDGIAAMAMIDAFYRSAAAGMPVAVSEIR